MHKQAKIFSSELNTIPQHKNLVVILSPDEDPKVYNDAGIDVTEHCASITIEPGQITKAIMYNHDTDDKHYRDFTIKEPTVAVYTTNVVNITGTWISKGNI